MTDRPAAVDTSAVRAPRGGPDRRSDRPAGREGDTRGPGRTSRGGGARGTQVGGSTRPSTPDEYGAAVMGGAPQDRTATSSPDTRDATTSTGGQVGEKADAPTAKTEGSYGATTDTSPKAEPTPEEAAKAAELAAKREKAIARARNAYLEGKPDAEAAGAEFDAKLVTLENPATEPEAIVAGRKELDMQVGELLDVLQANTAQLDQDTLDGKIGEVQLTIVQDALGTIDDKLISQEQKRTTVDAFKTLFKANPPSSNEEQANALSVLYNMKPQGFQDSDLASLGYVPSDEVRGIITARGELNPPTTPAPPAPGRSKIDLSAVPAEEREQMQKILEEQAKDEEQAQKDLDTLHDEHASEEHKQNALKRLWAWNNKCKRYYAPFMSKLIMVIGAGAAIIGVPVLVMSAIHAGGGGK